VFVGWWPLARVEKNRALFTSPEFLQHFERWRGSDFGFTDSRTAGAKGRIYTAEQLYEFRVDPERQAAILIAGCLHTREKRGELPKHWYGGPFFVMEEVNHALYAKGGPCHGGFAGWHHAMGDALPRDLASSRLFAAFAPKNWQEFVALRSARGDGGIRGVAPRGDPEARGGGPHLRAVE
jgi:hypothetical protein